jgi:chromosome condensin MukBEF complex kleisin-like MukF subunit
MDNVKLERETLLKKVKENKEKHVVLFNEAWIGYCEHVQKQLQEALDQSRQDIFKGFTKLTAPDIFDIPKNWESAYEDVIAMLEMSIDSEIILDYHDFRKYVMDRWDWKEQFQMSSIKYTTNG